MQTEQAATGRQVEREMPQEEAYVRWLADTHAPTLRKMDSEGAYAAAWAEATERCAQYLRDEAERLAPDGVRVTQADRHTSHVLACKGDELAAKFGA